jgi:nucleoside-diphosphate-sugar epimerase
MNILISGAFGFVGTNLSKANVNIYKHYIIAIDIYAPAKHFYNDFFEWKELNKINWNEVDAIIHLAGKAHDTKNVTEEKTYFDINVGLTKKIFEFFQKSNASKFIFFSSVKAVADKVVEQQLTETIIPNPKTPYGKSKLAAEYFLLKQPLSKDKKIYILRPSMIHGPGNKGNLNLLYKFSKKGIPWPLGNFNNRRSFTSIDNLTLIINHILEKDIEGGIYNIADDEAISTSKIIELIAELNGKSPHIWNLNKKIVLNLAKVGDILNLPLNSERLDKLTESYIVSNKKIKKALKIEKMPVNSIEGMKKTLLSF